MVKRVSQAAMLVAVLTLALALPVMAWSKSGTLACNQGGTPRTWTASQYNTTHIHVVDGWAKVYIGYGCVASSFSWTTGTVPYHLEVEWTYFGHAVSCT